MCVLWKINHLLSSCWIQFEFVHFNLFIIWLLGWKTALYIWKIESSPGKYSSPSDLILVTDTLSWPITLSKFDFSTATLDLSHIWLFVLCKFTFTTQLLKIFVHDFVLFAWFYNWGILLFNNILILIYDPEKNLNKTAQFTVKCVTVMRRDIFHFHK